MQIIDINFEDRTKPLTEVGLNKILVFTKSKNIAYKEVDSTDGVSELSSGDTGYKLIELILAQAKQTIGVFGVEDITYSSVKDELNKIAEKDFFFIVTDLTEKEAMKAVAEWGTSNKRMVILSTDASMSVDDIKSTCSEINSDNVGIFAHAGSPKGSETVFLNAGITGLMSPKGAGSATWALKSPNLIPNVTFDIADESDLIKNNVNVWAYVLGRGVTQFGKTTSGSYLDITQGKYWLENKLRSALAMLLMNRDKLPFTLESRALIMQAIREVVTAGDRQGIIVADETIINVPKPLELLPNDRANRVWSGITIESRIQGATETIGVKYILTV